MEKKDSSEQYFTGGKIESNWDGNFPQDVVIEILARLPVKSLLRFKCVCKYWYTIIKSRGFVSKHFNNENSRTGLLLYYVSGNEREGVSFLPDETLAGIPPLHDVIDHVLCPQIAEHLIGPVDGLFFLHTGGFAGSDGDHMTLWNPATREFWPLPVPPPIIPPYFSDVSRTFGFGLDPLTGNYKLIWIRLFIDERTGAVLPFFVVAVYTLGSDMWRYLSPLTPIGGEIENSLSATCINGTYYWLVSYNHDKHSILSFDMSCEVFRDIEGPCHHEERRGSLTLYNDSLALFLCQLYGVCFYSFMDIWVMKEEGCWANLGTVQLVLEISRPLGYWRNEELLLESRTSQLILYNHYTHDYRNLGIYGCSKRVFSYKESLLSVKPQNEDLNGWHLTVPANREKAMVDKTKELGKMIESFSHEQELRDRQGQLYNELFDIDYCLPEADLVNAYEMIFDDPTKLDIFFNLDGTHRNLYLEKLVRGG